LANSHINICGALAGGYALLKGNHIKVDVVSQRFPEKMAAIVDLITSPLAFVLCGLALWWGTIFAWEAFIESEVFIDHPGLNLPTWMLKSIAPAAALFLLLQVIAKFIRDLLIVLNRKEVSE